jgi:hypothetical protein
VLWVGRWSSAQGANGERHKRTAATTARAGASLASFIGGRGKRQFAHVMLTMWLRHGHGYGRGVRWNTTTTRLVGQPWSVRRGPCVRGAMGADGGVV